MSAAAVAAAAAGAGTGATSQSARARARRRLERAALYALLVLLSAGMLVPLVWALSASVKPLGDIFKIPVEWIPREWHWENYVVPFASHPFGRYFLNSILVAGAVTCCTLLFCSLAGYSLAKFNYPGRSLVFMTIVSTLMIPFEVVVIPLYLVVRDLGWIDSFRGLIIPVALSPFGVFLMRQFISTIPDAFIEAARIDGASEVRIFTHIILPLAGPALSALTIFTFMANWNSFLWPLVIVNRDELRTLPLGLAVFQGEYATIYNQLMAVCLLAILPILAIFMAMQKRVIQGMTVGGLKG